DLATAQYAREGLTSVTDAGVAGGWIGHAPGELAAYQNAREHAVLRTRMQVMPVIDALAGLGVHSGEPARLGLGAGVRTGWGDEGAVARPDEVARLAGLAVACVEQPSFSPSFGEGMRRAIGADRSAWSHRARSLLDAGLPVAFSSDRPVAPGAPLGGIQAFIERITEDGLPYGPDERLTAGQAVRAATEGSS